MRKPYLIQWETKWILILLVLSFLQMNSWAQFNGTWRFWTAQDGLTESYCQGLYPDPSGHLYILHGSVDHLSSFDGYTFEQIPVPNASMTSGNVSVNRLMFRNPDGSIWFADLNRKNDATTSLNFFKWWDGKEWHQIEVEPLNIVVSLAFFDNTRLLIQTIDNLYIWERGDRGYRALFEYEGNPENYVLSLHVSPGRCAYVMTVRKILKLQADLEHYQSIPYPIGNSLYSNLSFHTIPFRDQIFIEFEMRDPKSYRTYEFDGEDFSLIHQSNNHNSVFLPGYGNTYLKVMDKRGRLGKAPMFDVFPTGKEEEIEREGYLASSFFNFVPLQSKTWLGTGSSLAGLFPALWQTPGELHEVQSIVTGIREDADGGLWFLAGNQLVCLKNGEWDIITMPDNINAPWFQTANLFPMEGEGIYLISREGNDHLYRFDSAEHMFEEILLYPGEWFSYFVHPARDGNAFVMIGMNTPGESENDHYLAKYNGETFQDIFHFGHFVDIRDVYETAKGDIWFAQGSGAALLEKKEDGYELKSLEPPFNGSFSLLEVEPDHIWFGTRNSIWEYDGNDWRLIKDKTDQVHSMLKSQDGTLWVASWSGVYRFDGTTWVQYTDADGLANTQTMQVYEDRHNRIWVGTMSGISMFSPWADKEKPETIVPSHTNTRYVNQNGLAQIVFDGVDRWNYTPPDRLLFSYSLNGGEWSSFTRDRIAVFENLPAQQHQIEIRSMDLNFNVDETPALWMFTVLLPWYKQPLFILATIFGSMLTLIFGIIALQRHFKLQHAYVHVQQANEELKELDKMKSSFVSQASHDLRTPLTAIKGTLDNLGMGIAGELTEKQQQLLTRASKSVDRLNHLVNDVLDIARIESGRVVLNKTTLSFKTLVENIVTEERPAADQKQIRLTFLSDDKPYSIYADGGKLERVVGELISNAIKYTSTKGTIEVLLTKQENQVILSVKDSGIGMSPEECKQIWDRFYRTPASQKVAKGTGLGLSIAKELVELHGGQLQVSSEIGRGTTFTLTLPIEQLEALDGTSQQQ